MITNAEKAIWDFIWDGKPDKVKRDVCRRQQITGGIGVPNIRNILCAQRLNFLAKVTCNKPISEHCIPHFYKSCLHMWKDLPHDKFPWVSVNTISNYFQPVTQNEDQHLRRFEEVKLNLENSLFIKDTNETWVDLNICKHDEQKDVGNLIAG